MLHPVTFHANLAPPPVYSVHLTEPAFPALSSRALGSDHALFPEQNHGVGHGTHLRTLGSDHALFPEQNHGVGPGKQLAEPAFSALASRAPSSNHALFPEPKHGLDHGTHLRTLPDEDLLRAQNDAWRGLRYCPDPAEVEIWRSLMWRDYMRDLWDNGVFGMFAVWSFVAGHILWQVWGDAL